VEVEFRKEIKRERVREFELAVGIFTTCREHLELQCFPRDALLCCTCIQRSAAASIGVAPR
jgi:hypothetical protein